MTKKKTATIVTAAVLIAVIAIICGVYMHNKNAAKAMRADGVSDIEKTVSLSDYRKTQQNDIKDIIDKYEKKINDAEDQKDVDKYVADAKKELKAVKTDAQLTRSEKAAAKAAKKKAAEKKAAEEAAAAAARASQSASSSSSSGGQSRSSYSGGSSSNSSHHSSSGASGSSGSSSAGGSNTDGCVDDSAANYY